MSLLCRTLNWRICYISDKEEAVQTYEIVSGLKNSEEITDFRQTASCFK
ncbi:MAG: hypothetical protein IT292_11755 [Deltaproteobacteria bacterium]|nr:hypothetical protein [Deltaproteobacteria bacterium]